MENSEQTKLAAIVFTDIVGYTQKMDSDEMLTMRYLQRQQEIVYPIVKDFGGKVLKEIGDGLLIMFDSAVQAVRATIEMQNQLKDEKFQIRAGVHMGDVIMKDGDVFGAAVNIAARVEPLAKAGGICVSEVVRYQIRNKIDIKTVSVGIRELKGVRESIEIFEILFGDQKERAQEKISFLKHVWQRRVPQITGIYAMLVLFIYFVLEYVSANFMLSPHLVEFGIVLLLSLLPSVLLMGYFHGKAASGEWKKIERFGLPINLVISAVVLFTVFSDKDLGATTTSVNVVDENGQLIEREISKNEFRKSMAIFFFENKTADTTLNWLEYGLPFMISYDLLQDFFIRSEGSFGLFQDILNEGYTIDQALPLSVKEKIASQRHLNHIVTGDIEKNAEGEYVLTIFVRQTKTGNLISEKEYKGNDIFNLIDQISRQLRSDVKIPDKHIAEVRDFPVAEMSTSSVEAFESYIKSMSYRFFHNDFTNAQLFAEEAVAIDPTFILAHAMLIDIYVSTSNKIMTDSTFKFLMQHLTVLPEQIQFQIKYSYYVIVKQDADKAVAVIKMWKDLYPYEINAYLLLAGIYERKNEPEKALAEYEEVLRLDPERYDCILNIAKIYDQQSKYDEAIQYYKKYISIFPESIKPYLEIGDIYFVMRNFDLAKSNYEKVQLIKHDNIPASLGLLNIELLMGKYTTAENKYKEVLSYCKTPQDKYTVLQAMVEFYALTGQMEKAIESMETAYIEIAKYTDPINVIISQAFELDKYVVAGKSDKAFEKIKGFKAELSPPVDKLISIGYLFLYMELDQIEDIENTIVDAEDAIQMFQYDILKPLVESAKAKVMYLKGDYQGSIDYLKVFLKENPAKISSNSTIGYCYRKLKKYDKALEHYNILLERNPFDPDYNYRIALVYSEMGEKAKALEHLKAAIMVWKNADAIYEPAKLANEKYLELTQ